MTEGNGSSDIVQIKPAVQIYLVPRWMAAQENQLGNLR